MELFDRPDDDVRLEQSAFDWMRDHAPGDARVLTAATRRNARTLGWVGRVVLCVALASIFYAWRFATGHAQAFSPIDFTLFGFIAGFLLGVSQQVATAARFLRLLAMLKGEGRSLDSGAPVAPAGGRSPQ